MLLSLLEFQERSMTHQISQLRKRAYTSPPKLKNGNALAETDAASGLTAEPKDELASARHKEERKIKWKQVALQFGLAMNSLAGGINHAYAAPPEMAQVMENPAITNLSAGEIDLAIEAPEQQDLRATIREFTPQEFTTKDATESLETFADEGRVFRNGIGSDKDLSSEAAAKRLQNGQSLDIELIDGTVHRLSSLEELQAFDTFHGLGLKPVAPPEVVRALQSLELGVDDDDGLIRKESTFSSENTFSAYEAYNILSTAERDSTGSTLKGALIGGAIVGAGIGITVLGGGALLPGLAMAASSASPMLLGVSGVALAAGLGAGAYLGARSYNLNNPDNLEIRYGMDSGLKIRNLEHAVDVHGWLQERAANPFTEEQQGIALEHFESTTGFQDASGKAITMDQARERLANGEEVKIPSSIAGHTDSISNLRQLQQLDTVRGSGINPTVPPHVSSSLRALESGSGPADGLYKAGNFEPEGRLSAFEAVDHLFRNRESINVIVKGKQYDTSTLANVQELNALMGDGINTILPDQQFQAIRQFGSQGLISLETTRSSVGRRGNQSNTTETSTVDAYEALQAIRGGQEVKVNSRQRLATVASLEDFHELKSLEFDRNNSIVSDRDFQLLRHWELEGGYSVDNDGQKDYAYEALQALQSGETFGINHRGRTAAVKNVEDMVELSALETPKAGFEHSISDVEYRLLQHWENNGEYRVDGDHSEFAFEGLQALQAGRQFDIKSNGRFAPVSSYQDMAELSAFETPDAGFEHTIPAVEFDRLTYFEGVNGNSTVQIGNRKGRAYEGYRALRSGNSFDMLAGGVWNTVTSTQALHDLDALLGRGVNDILPQDQYDLLKHLGDEQEGEGLYAGSEKLNSYSALQQFRDENGISYQFTAGDFDSRLSIGTSDLESLARTKEIRDNQRDYDRYSYSAQDWQDKMSRQADGLPSLAADNLSYAQGELRDGERALSDAESDLSDAESDLRRARSDLSSAESDLRRARSELSSARSMPSKVDVEVEYCNRDTGKCWWETEQEHNHDRDRAISSARSWVSSAERDVSSAESDIRRARSDISSAESDISSARSEISRARGLISEANQLIGSLEAYKTMLDGTNESNLAQTVSAVKAKLEEFRSLTHINSLRDNLGRQSKLISNHETRPDRPKDWVAPAREDLAQF